jgi:signal transduction histidine kinase
MDSCEKMAPRLAAQAMPRRRAWIERDRIAAGPPANKRLGGVAEFEADKGSSPAPQPWRLALLGKRRSDRLEAELPAAPPNVLAGFGGCCITIDLAWRVAGLTPQAADWLRVSERELLGVDLRDHMPVPRSLIDSVETSFSTGRPSHVEMRGAVDDGRWIECQAHPFASGASLIFWGVNEPRLAEQAALQQASEKLLSAQEEERERIAIELHDSTSQHLVALGLGVARLRRLLGAGAGMEDVLDDMSSAVQEAVREIRVFSYLMKPPCLARDGLEMTARAFVKGFGSRTGLNALFHSEGPVDGVSADVRHAAFRVIQEALSNVYRHAHATGVEVQLAVRGGVFTLRVADDGKGFAPPADDAAAPVSLGVGIAGMRARVEQLCGELDICGAGPGTVVTARVPAAPSRAFSV